MEIEPRPSYVLRKSMPEDIEAERRMQAASWRAAYPSPEHGVSAEWVEEETSQWLTQERLKRSRDHLKDAYDNENQLRYTALHGDEVVGFIHCTKREDGTIELAALYTDPLTFRTGLGDQLMAVADEWIGDAEAHLEVATYNARAIRFYEKHGYALQPGTESIFRDKIPIIKMVRKATK